VPLREQEVRHFLPQINPNGLILMHDASSQMKTVREAALRLEQEGLISVVLLPTPRGLVVAQKREGGSSATPFVRNGHPDALAWPSAIPHSGFHSAQKVTFTVSWIGTALEAQL